RLIQVEDAAGYRSTMTYDVYGNKVAMRDPDTGSAYYEYNAAGELVRESEGWEYKKYLNNDSRMYEERGQVIVEARSGNIWNEEDTHNYVYQSLNGDGEIIAKLSSIEYSLDHT